MDQVNQPLGAGSPATRNVIDRAKNILTQPAKEWDAIALEQPNTSQIITGYVLPLAGAAALAAFIGYGFVGYSVFGIRVAGIEWGIYHALTVLITALLTVFISAMVIDALAPSFGSEKNMSRSVQLVAYSNTPSWIGGLLALYPPLSMIGAIAGLYGLYIMYIGLPKIKKTPQDKQVGYFVVSLITVIVIYIILGLILSAILMPIFGISYGSRRLF